MDPITTALELLKRQTELEAGLGQPGVARPIAERELYALRECLQRYPQAARAILETARNLNRPIDSLQARDVRIFGSG